jgi:hypothetical protein
MNELPEGIFLILDGLSWIPTVVHQNMTGKVMFYRFFGRNCPKADG